MIVTSFLTIGATKITEGNAIINANPHALSHISNMSSTNPTLKILMAKDMIHDMSSAMKKAKT